MASSLTYSGGEDPTREDMEIDAQINNSEVKGSMVSVLNKSIEQRIIENNESRETMAFGDTSQKEILVVNQLGRTTDMDDYQV